MKRLDFPLVSALVSLLVIAAAVAVVFVAIVDYSRSYSERQPEQIRDTVLAYVAQCYALEGRYPESLDYLEENYGLQLDRSRYIYHYATFASNVFPDVQVLPIGG